jgi:hypothetical protein
MRETDPVSETLYLKKLEMVHNGQSKSSSLEEQVFCGEETTSNPTYTIP